MVNYFLIRQGEQRHKTRTYKYMIFIAGTIVCPSRPAVVARAAGGAGHRPHQDGSSG